MAFFRVRDDQVVGHNGVDRHAGEILELPLHVGFDVREKLEPCTEDGESLAALSPEDLVVAQARAHERVAIREQQVEAAKAALAAAEEALETEKAKAARTEAAAPTVGTPAPAKSEEPGS